MVRGRRRAPVSRPSSALGPLTTTRPEILVLAAMFGDNGDDVSAEAGMASDLTSGEVRVLGSYSEPQGTCRRVNVIAANDVECGAPPWSERARSALRTEQPSARAERQA